MKSILVIADDFSGAAEMAGIGSRFGIPTRLLRTPAGNVFSGLTVIDTDTRSLAPSAAIARVENALSHFAGRQFDLIYKKIDSVLRGPVLAEIRAAMHSLGYETAVVVPQNPSRGRTISGGVYRVNGVPLAQTEFAADPEYPAQTSIARDRIGLSEGDTAIFTPNAETGAEIAALASAMPTNALAVGAADFFMALLQHRGAVEQAEPMGRVVPARRLFVCGTASTQREALLHRAASLGIVCCPIIPGKNSAPSVRAAGEAIAQSGSAVVYIAGEPHTGAHLAEQFQTSLLEACQSVLLRYRVDTVFAEGGATASALCARMGWTSFGIEHEWSPGVVQLKILSGAGGSIAPQPVFIVKPGSYPWPDAIWR